MFYALPLLLLVLSVSATSAATCLPLLLLSSSQAEGYKAELQRANSELTSLLRDKSKVRGRGRGCSSSDRFLACC
jgi:hypothetical protein